MSNKKAFTLIELLVVVAIIAMLAAISVVALNNARARARDSKRLADIKQIQTALELYYLDQNGYPATASVASGSAISSGGTVYMAQVPTAPQPSDCWSTEDKYTYTAQGAAGAYTSYTLQYCLGASSGGIAAGLRTATPAGISN
ncbi:MAG: Type II secretion system protein G precursor [Parcubacteria group bacterium ADurb.Bin159]|jgi:general secretion pathway protein G|nr:MAG: Type II secretion system protein G precursor [Parcubacteria group bacterium ADurb.Bin159]